MDSALPSCQRGTQFDLGPFRITHTESHIPTYMQPYIHSEPAQPAVPSNWLPCTEQSGGNSDSHADCSACFLRLRESESGIHSDFFKPMCHPAGEATHRMPLFTLFGRVIQWWVTVTP